MRHALVVDSDADTAETIAALISAGGMSVSVAGSLAGARRQMALRTPDVVLLEVELPDGSGLHLIEEIKQSSGAEVILMTACATVETSVQALRKGADDYVSKPVTTAQLTAVLKRINRASTLTVDASSMQESLDRDGHFGLLWGRSAPMQFVYQQIQRVAGSSVTVFVTGESGTGKELVARSVHDLSRRSGRAFLGVNCGAISPTLMESEIFGHEKGSFTGAERQHLGFFERANGGTLFLDEITEMPLDLQVKLLRVLETGTFMRVGSMQTQQTDVRIIAASNRDPMQAVATGRMREDLLYRLNVFPIDMPPLRDHRDDVPLIATHFLEEIASREGLTKRFAPQALAQLTAYAWPGNVRELRNIVQRAYVMALESTIIDVCLPRGEGAVPVSIPADGTAMVNIEVGTSLADIERAVTLATFEYFGRHRERTAAALGISLKTLYNRLKDYTSMQPMGLSPVEAAPSVAGALA